jgi:enamine deaminase RidA (YjgF/YER057c/UK114 family)
MEKVLKCSVYFTSVEKFGAVNEIYARYLPKNPLRGSLSTSQRGRAISTSNLLHSSALTRGDGRVFSDFRGPPQ